MRKFEHRKAESLIMVKDPSPNTEAGVGEIFCRAAAADKASLEGVDSRRD